MPEPRSAPLTRFDISSRDPELTLQVVREAYGDHSMRFLRHPKDFWFSQRGVATPAFTLLRCRYSMTAQMWAEETPRDLTVATVAAGRLTAGSGRDLVTSGFGEPMLMPPDRTGWHAELADVTVYAVRLDRPSVDRAAAATFGIDPARLSFSSRTLRCPAAARYWHSLVAHVRRDVLDEDTVAASPLVLANATLALATAALSLFPNSGLALLDDHASPDRGEPAVLRRAIEYIEQHAGENITLHDIAEAARIGVRGLQAVFRRHRDATPLQHLRRVRLARAHADLQAGDPGRGDTVATIAARWGFASAGRFSVAYREAYGTSPSKTLRS